MASSPGPEVRAVRTLEVVLTAACNMRCSYCYQNDKKARRMEWAALQPALDFVLSSESPALNILFIGGEPLLELELIRRAVAYVEANLSPGRRVTWAMSTNGLLLDDVAIKFLAQHWVKLQLSFDGVRPAQDLRGAGTFSALDALLDRLDRDHGLFFRRRFNVAITLHSKNVRHLADSVEYFIKKRVRDIALGPMYTHDPGWTAACTSELEAQFDRILELSLAHYRTTGLVPVEHFRRTGPASDERVVERSMCGVGTGEAIAVDVDGQMTGCVTFVESYQKLPQTPLARGLEAMRLGDVRSPDLRRRLALYPAAASAAQIFDDKQNKRSSLASCGECRFLDECSVCPTSILHIPGNDDPMRVPDHLCAFNLVMLSHAERFPRQEAPLEYLAKHLRSPDPNS